MPGHEAGIDFHRRLSVILAWRDGRRKMRTGTRLVATDGDLLHEFAAAISAAATNAARRQLPPWFGLVTASITRSRLRLPGFWRAEFLEWIHPRMEAMRILSTAHCAGSAAGCGDGRYAHSAGAVRVGNATLHQLAKAGWVKKAYRPITITNLKGLSRFAESGTD